MDDAFSRFTAELASVDAAAALPPHLLPPPVGTSAVPRLPFLPAHGALPPAPPPQLAGARALMPPPPVFLPPPPIPVAGFQAPPIAATHQPPVTNHQAGSVRSPPTVMTPHMRVAVPTPHVQARPVLPPPPNPLSLPPEAYEDPDYGVPPMPKGVTMAPDRPPAQASGSAAAGGGDPTKKKGVLREAAGKRWRDPTLDEWPDNDFRVFVGNLGKDVNDDVLCKAFQKYPSFVKARVVKDSHTKKTKGYGFVSFMDVTDGGKALKEMDGKYVGNRPVKLRKSSWEERNPSLPQPKKHKQQNKQQKQQHQ